MSVLKDLLRFAEICWPQLRYFISTSEFEDRRQRNAYLNIGCKQKLRIAVNDNLGIEPRDGLRGLRGGQIVSSATLSTSLSTATKIGLYRGLEDGRKTRAGRDRF